jgi:aldose 1-epimerase
MDHVSPEERADALLAAPAGCALLVIANEHQFAPAELVKPEIMLWAIGSAMDVINPWHGWGHDRLVARALERAASLRPLALEIVSEPGLAWMWAPIDRAHQLQLPRHDSFICPEEVWELKPRTAPTEMEQYVHAPRPAVTTSEAWGTLSSELATVLSGPSDWDLEFPIHARAVTIRPSARVLEIVTPQDWHELARRYPCQATHRFNLSCPDTPWGVHEGQVVPDWHQVATDWDGVHITPWAYLTATQVRVHSDIGWTEPWAWDGAHTVWLDWMFDSVEDVPPITEEIGGGPRYSAQAFNFGDPDGWLQAAPGVEEGEFMQAGITREPFGEIDGQAVERFTLTNELGMRASILSYGGIIQSLEVPDRHGTLGNVVLGFRTLEEYAGQESYHGALIGRFANRIANGRFSLDGTEYSLAVNNGPNSLHGGLKGFDRQVWEASIMEVDGTPDAPKTLVLRRISPDGEEGYPGTLDVTIHYRWMGPSLSITYWAKTDAPTVLNLTNHTYFNLAGEGSGSILGHVLQMRARRYTPVNENLIPTGAISPVEGTPFDFTEARVIGDRIDTPGNDQLAFAGGYDHNFVFDTADELGFEPEWKVRLGEPGSGRMMQVNTTQPGVQFYTGNFLDGTQTGASGRQYESRSGVCLETQHFPDSPNQPEFPSTVLRPDEQFMSHTSLQFGVMPGQS